MALILNPKYRMRNEKDKILMYSTDFWGLMEKQQFIHPLYAILLALFDGEKEFEEVEREFCYITNSSPFEEGKRVVEYMLNVLKSQYGDDLLVESSSLNSKEVRTYDPDDFIINRKDLDFSNFRLSAPLDLNYNVTFRCNRKCIYCYAENEFAPKMEELSLNRLKEILDEAEKLKVNGIIFAGGEPFLRKDFLEILEYTIQNGISYCISTKAHLNKEVCKRLKEIGVEKIQVSIDSIEKEEANFLTGSNDFYSEILDTVKNLANEGLKIRIKSVVTRYNIKGIPSLITFFAKWGISNFQAVAYGRSIYRHDDSLFASLEELEELKVKLNEIKEVYKLNILYGGYSEDSKGNDVEEKEKKFKDRAICSAGRSSLNILPDGRVNLCEQIPSKEEFIIGDLKNQSLLEIWNSKKLLSHLKPKRKNFKNTVCFDCKEFEECNWLKGRCFRNAYHVFGSIFAPDPRCPKANVDIRFS